MRVRANTVAYNETGEVDKTLPEVTQSRKELIEGVKSTAVYNAKSKDEFAESLREVVKTGEQRGRLYGKDIETTSNNFIHHLDRLRTIGEILNPKSGRYTGRANFNPRGESKSQDKGLEFTTEDRQKLVKFLTSEYNQCKREIARVDRAIDASEKAYGNFVLYKTGMAALEPNRTGYAERGPESILKIKYHKMQEKNYNHAADDYHKSAKSYSEAQYYDSAIKQRSPELIKEDLLMRNQEAISHLNNTEVNRLLDEERGSTKDYVQNEVEIVLKNLDVVDERKSFAGATQLIGGANFREVNGITKYDVDQLKRVVSVADDKIKLYKNSNVDLSAASIARDEKIARLKEEVIDSVTRFGKEQTDGDKKYKTLVTKSEYLQDAAAGNMSRAEQEINHYEENGYQLKSIQDHIQTENTNIRLSVTKFKELKSTVTEFRDNLRAFVSSVVPIERTLDKSASTPITKKVLGAVVGAEAIPVKRVPPGAAGMMRAREMKRESIAMSNAKEVPAKDEPKEEPRRFKI